MRARMWKRRSRGFTLIELMIVVAVVAVLSVLGLYSYRRYLSSAKLAEATHMVAAIEEGEERYKSEIGNYADISTSLTSTFPSGSPGDFKTGWGGACAGCKAGMSFASISVQTSDPVQFGYAVVAGTPTNKISSRAGTVAMNGKNLDFTLMDGKNSFVAMARDDADGDGAYTQVVGTSLNNDIIIDDNSP